MYICYCPLRDLNWNKIYCIVLVFVTSKQLVFFYKLSTWDLKVQNFISGLIQRNILEKVYHGGTDDELTPSDINSSHGYLEGKVH